MTPLLNVLLVEDDAEDKNFFMHCLEKSNLYHNIIWAKDHDELFQVLEREPEINLAIVDLDMPGKNGKECLKEIKAHQKYKTIPVIVMTVSKKTNDIDEVFENGAHYYAIKPYSQVNFTETLKTIFRIDWKIPQPIPEKKHFIINLAFA
jgi:DNA-binding response OmpR family regulator